MVGCFWRHPEPVFVRSSRPFKEPRNRFPAWRACTTTLFVVPARQATWVGGIGLSESIPGLHKRLQIRALDVCALDDSYSITSLSTYVPPLITGLLAQ